MELYDQGSLDRAYFGEYSFSVSKVFSEARERANGVKLTFISTLLIYLLIALSVYLFLSIIVDTLPSLETMPYIPGFLKRHPGELLSIAILSPLFIGLIMMGLKQANDHKIIINDVFAYHSEIGRLLLASLLISLFMTIGLILFIVPGLYVMLVYVFTFPLMIDKKLGIWEAMELSRRSVSVHWFRFVIFDIVILSLLFISAIPFGLGLFWTIPIVFISYGIVYRKIFGYSGKKVSAS